MSKKHFIALADAIREHNRTCTNNDYFSEEQQVALATFCKSQNPRFNRERWFGYIAGTNGPNGGRVRT